MPPVPAYGLDLLPEVVLVLYLTPMAGHALLETQRFLCILNSLALATCPLATGT